MIIPRKALFIQIDDFAWKMCVHMHTNREIVRIQKHRKRLKWAKQVFHRKAEIDYKPNTVTQKDILDINQYLLYQLLCLRPCTELFAPTKGREKHLTLPEGQEDYRLHHEEFENWAIRTEQFTCGEVEKEEGIECQADRDVVNDRHIEVAAGYTAKRRDRNAWDFSKIFSPAVVTGEF